MVEMMPWLFQGEQAVVEWLNDNFLKIDTAFNFLFKGIKLVLLSELNKQTLV